MRGGFVPADVAVDASRGALEAACLEGLIETPHGWRYRPSKGADAIEPLIVARERRAAADAWDDCLATVTRGIESAKDAHAKHGHRQIVSALVGLAQAVPRTENPHRAGAES